MKGKITYGKRFDKTNNGKKIRKDQITLYLRLSDSVFEFEGNVTLLTLKKWFKSLKFHTERKGIHGRVEVYASLRFFGILQSKCRVATIYPGDNLYLEVRPEEKRVFIESNAGGAHTISHVKGKFCFDTYKCDGLKLSSKATETITYDYKNLSVG